MPLFDIPDHYRTTAGEQLNDGVLYYESLGNPEGEVIWVCHALTGSATVKEWWPTLFKEYGGYIDLEKHHLVCANSLGSCYGSTNAKEINSSLSSISHRDVVSVFHLLKEHLKVKKIDLLLGGSLGGQQVLEWLICFPDDIAASVLIACNAWHSSWGIAWNELQRNAIDLAKGEEGLALARKIAMLSYRSSIDFDQKTLQKEPSSIIPYLDYQGDKFIKRFNKASYYLLSRLMDSHNISLGRVGGAKEILAAIKIPVLVIGINSDVLFPLSEQVFLAENIRQGHLAIIDSEKGHDAFLLEGNYISSQIDAFYLNIKNLA